ncbi:hypothetical protein ROZALSC1DRAFT_24670, partial [Rozella allomycis CSF55]
KHESVKDDGNDEGDVETVDNHDNYDDEDNEGTEIFNNINFEEDFENVDYLNFEDNSESVDHVNFEDDNIKTENFDHILFQNDKRVRVNKVVVENMVVEDPGDVDFDRECQSVKNPPNKSDPSISSHATNSNHPVSKEDQGTLNMVPLGNYNLVDSEISSKMNANEKKRTKRKRLPKISVEKPLKLTADKIKRKHKKIKEDDETDAQSIILLVISSLSVSACLGMGIMLYNRRGAHEQILLRTRR